MWCITIVHNTIVYFCRKSTKNCLIRTRRRQGGLGSKKHVDLIWKIPSLWCQRFLRNVKILFRSEVIDVSMCWPFDFSIVILGVIFDIFYTSFGYKNRNIETNTSKCCTKVHCYGLPCTKNSGIDFFSILADFDKFRLKIAYFLQKCDLKKNH